MSTRPYDVAIVGGGIVGTATAKALAERFGGSIVVLEAEAELAAHQTGHNSGVIHSGLYYKPGSLKAKNCVEGRRALYRFCEEQGIPHDRCGKLVVATRPHEIPVLDELEQRGHANGLEGVRRLGPDEMKEIEPAVSGMDALFVPDTGIVDYIAVTRAYARSVEALGGEIRTHSRVSGFAKEHGGLVLETESGEVHCRNLINCAGLQSDRIARLCGMDPGIRIVPFRGEYYELKPETHHLVKNLIYPVPDARFPFLGVHFTRMIHGGVEAGPNAVLAFKREGYRKHDISLGDLFSYLFYPGFWRMSLQHWRMGLGEMWRSFSKTAFVKGLQALVPSIRKSDVVRAGSGVRAQALAPDGKLLDDFHIVEAERQIHVLNAPSPAATASLSIGRNLAEMAGKSFGF